VRIDPASRLGRPMRLVLVTEDDATLPVTATLRVTGRYVVARRPLARGEHVAAADLETVMGELTGVLLRPLPLAGEIAGARVRRPVAAGATVTAADVIVPRTIEPGDAVTVTAAAGAVAVSAAMIAADGGDVGDVIRVVNPGSHRYLRGRVVKRGEVEVTGER
jgi:flagella basal body P-ring formation protein FlgA